ncbi:hypothetical protein E2320_009418, partial [Naja naja]
MAGENLDGLLSSPSSLGLGSFTVIRQHFQRYQGDHLHAVYDYIQAPCTEGCKHNCTTSPVQDNPSPFCRTIHKELRCLEVSWDAPPPTSLKRRTFQSFP